MKKARRGRARRIVRRALFLLVLFGVMCLAFIGVGVVRDIVVSRWHTKELPHLDIALDSELYLPVPLVLQHPALPNGCEITSLTAVLRYYKYDVTHTTMSDVYLPRQPFVRRNGELYGANPYVAYVGNPRDQQSGFFCYAPPIVEAARRYLAAVKGVHTAFDVSGSTWRQLINYLDEGIPVVAWVTEDLEKIRPGFAWRLIDSGDYYSAPGNLHAVVINGYSGEYLHVMDPVRGQVRYNAGDFFAAYYALGSHAVIVR